MKRIMGVLASVSIVGGLLAGCGGAKTNDAAAVTATPSATTSAASTAAPNEAKKLKLWFYYEGKDRFDKISALTQGFNKTQSSITLTPEYVPFDQFKKRLSMGMAASDLPDIVIIDNPDHAAYAKMGLFADITDKVKAISGIDQFFDGPMKSATLDGKIYGLPFASNNIALFYNSDMLDKAGIKPPQTWDDLKAAAKKLTTGDTKGLAISAPQNEEGTFQFMPWLLSTGASVEKMDSPEGIKALTFLSDLVKDGSMSKEVINWTQSDAMKQFIAGKAAMMINGPWQLPEIKKNAPDLKYGVTLVPKDKQFASVLGGENLGVINGKNVDASVEFLKYFAQPDVMKNFTKEFGNFPPRKDVAADKAWTEDLLVKGFADEMQYAQPRGPSPKWPEISNAISTALAKSLTQNSTPEANAKEAQAKIEQIIKK